MNGEGNDDAEHGDAVAAAEADAAEAAMDAGLESGAYGWGDISAVETGTGDTEHGGYETVAQAVMDNVNNPQVAIDFGRENVQYGPEHNFMGFRVSDITGPGQDDIDALDALQGMNWGDTQYSDGAAFPSMYDPAPPVVEQPVIDPITQPGPTTSPEDSILFHFTPRERHSYLLNQIEMGMEPTRGYTGPDGIFVDLTTVYPDIFNPDIFIPDQVFTQPVFGDAYHHLPPPRGDRTDGVGSGRNLDGGFIDVGHIRGDLGGDGVLPRMTLGDPGGYEFDPVTGDYIDGGGGYKYGGYVDDYRMNRGGIMDLREPHLYNRGGNVMRNIHEEQARVAARERNAREEMGRLRGEARYEDRQTFNQGGVASLAPVARDMFRKRRLPRAGMVV